MKMKFKSKKMRYIAAMILVISSCIKHKSKEEKTLKDYQLVSKTEKAKDSLSFHNIMKLSQKEAIQKYGNPLFSESFTLCIGLVEFRVGLENKYSLEDRKKETIIIDELTWERDSIRYITVWYEKFNGIAKDSLTLYKDTEF